MGGGGGVKGRVGGGWGMGRELTGQNNHGGGVGLYIVRTEHNEHMV